MGGPEGPGRAQGRHADGSTGRRPARALTWGEAETLDILNDAETMRDIAASREDMRARRVVAWKPRDAKSTQSA